jgi:YidC/Oxa1 family membrane protein insertase
MPSRLFGKTDSLQVFGLAQNDCCAATPVSPAASISSPPRLTNQSVNQEIASVNLINQAMLYLLHSLYNLVGNYGLAIVLLTVAIRLALWPLNTKQTLSMRRMQAVQPKMKLLQERHKGDPQKMQQEVMKLYSESGLNPLAGCLPMLAQIPIFLGLYGALSSPQFLAETVHDHFLFLNNLSHTLRSHAGTPLDGTFDVMKDDTFSSARTIMLKMKDGKVQEQEVAKQNDLISVTPKPIMPGSPITMLLDFKAMGLSQDYSTRIESADVLVTDNKSRELENVHFENVNGALSHEVPTKPGKDTINYDVAALVILYACLTLGYQKVMTHWAPKPSTEDPNAAMQASMMKFMPIAFVAMMFFIPIPAGALIYLVVTTALMMIQTLYVNKNEDKRLASVEKPGSQVVNISADKA